MINKVIDAQYRRPSGAIGHLVGNLMAAQHRPENAWTVAQLAPAADDHVLEVGFGPGVALAAVARRTPRGRVAGIDYSPAMVAAARARCAAAGGAGRVLLACGDAVRLPFRAAAFDKAFSIHSIYFWPDQARGLAELYRVVKPGGLVVLTILPKERWPANPDGTWGTPVCHPLAGDELAGLLRVAGFAGTRLAVDADTIHASNYSVLAVK